MYELTCPECQTANSVTPAKAGGELACAACSHSIAVPKLGELKRLPLVDGSAEKSQLQTGPSGLSGGRSMAFAALGAVSLLCFLGTAFCGVNWATINVPTTTESHLADLKATYRMASAARLIREYEDITKYFTLMGWTAFGGPQAHIGMFETVCSCTLRSDPRAE